MLGIFVVLTMAVAGEAVKPLILIPGALASQIQAKLDKPSSAHWYCDKKHDWYTLWLNIPSLLPGSVNCWGDNFQMQFNDDVFSNVEGVETRVPGFGESHTLDYVDDHEWVSYYRDLVKAALALPGAREGVSVRTAPYDFRYSPPSSQSSLYYKKLKLMIEEAYTQNGNTSSVIVSHSLGAVVTSTFLHNQTAEWKQKYVGAWVSAAPALGGTLKEVKVVVSHGIFGDIPDLITSRLVHRDVARTIMSNYALLPRAELWAADEVLLRTPSASYTVDSLDQMLLDMGVTDGPAKRAAVANAGYLGDPGVPTHCFSGKNIETPSGFYYDNQEDFPDEVPEAIPGDGDGTVPLRTLQLCHGWNSTVGVVEYSGDGGIHDKIVENPDFVQRIINIISQ